MATIKDKASKPEEWVNTPRGVGLVMARSDVPVYQEIRMSIGEPFKVFDRDPFVDVFIPGRDGGIYSFPPGEVKPAQPPTHQQVTATNAFQRYQRGKEQPQRGQFRAVLARVGDTFTVKDVEHALLAAVGDRAIKKVPRSYPQRASTMVRRMLKRGFISPVKESVAPAGKGPKRPK